jgi:hypothetical protein
MSFTAVRRRWSLALLAACTLGVLGASPALAASTAINPLGCSVPTDLSTPLTGLGDFNLYTLAPGGSFEPRTATGWSLQNAALRLGNEPYQVVGRSHAWSLGIANGGVATSAPMCVDETFPNFRFFARSGTAKAQLEVKVLFLDAKGNVKSAKSGTLGASGTGWQLVNPMKIGIAIDTTALNGAAPIAFQFSSKGDWTIDDLLVDPYRRS